jgi:phage shock protein E
MAARTPGSPGTAKEELSLAALAPLAAELIRACLVNLLATRASANPFRLARLSRAWKERVMSLNAIMSSKKLLALLGFAALASVLLWSARREAGANDALRAGAHLVDVRTPQEFAEGHLDGAVNIPVQDLATRMGEVGSKSEPVVVYCRSGQRSARAKRMLVEAGFERVYDLGAMSNGQR